MAVALDQFQEHSTLPPDATYNLLTKSMSTVFAVLSRADVSSFLYVSPSAHNAFGFSPDEMLGRSMADFVHAEDVPRLTALCEEATKQGGAQGSAVRVRHACADGSTLVVECKACSDEQYIFMARAWRLVRAGLRLD